MRGAEVKYPLNKAMEPYPPNDLFYRPNMGFAISLDKRLRERLQQLTQDACAAGLGRFDMDYVQPIIYAHRSGSRDFSPPLWCLATLDALLVQRTKCSAANSRDSAETAGRSVA